MNDNFLIKLTDTCFLDEDTNLALVKDTVEERWCVIDMQCAPRISPGSRETAIQYMYSLRHQKGYK